LAESSPDWGEVVDGAGAAIAGGGIGGERLIFRVFDRPVLGLLMPASFGEDRSVLTCDTTSEPCSSTASPL